MGLWRRLGDLDLLLLSDGVVWMDAGGIFGVVPRVMWEPIVGPPDDHNRLALNLNCLLVRSQGKTVLIETGCGSKGVRAPAVGQVGTLLAGLAQEGVRPEDIDIVVNTHLHFDHGGGNTTLANGVPAPTFPEARYVFQRDEWEAAQHPNERTRATYLPENLEPLADARLVDLVEGEVEVVKGVRLVPAPGHSAGHAVVEVESGGELLIYLGDLAQYPVMLERVAWVSAFDIFPLVSIETKKRITERAIEKRALMVFSHGPYPGLGRLRLEGGKRRWEAE